MLFEWSERVRLTSQHVTPVRPPHDPELAEDLAQFRMLRTELDAADWDTSPTSVRSATASGIGNGPAPAPRPPSRAPLSPSCRPRWNPTPRCSLTCTPAARNCSASSPPAQTPALCVWTGQPCRRR
ncbi:hypothetical protein [Microbacterium sp. NIBRBAC000506063]|uniref:hypothetical protein n=1 Tax=Microbacterium sp. NIBRBAC000506063 TaxID=2734618 RepID=UPI001BB4C6FE|nr:hypothetical protein [Microbacterium sp. NIBRBAC000506063]QTV80309.1 hypothetical protein KAE78_04870 [Microbacterium sp. NIBRBAC000506063]